MFIELYTTSNERQITFVFSLKTMSIKFVKFLVNGWVCDKVIKNYFYNEMNIITTRM
jgi:hypothetical protein